VIVKGSVKELGHHDDLMALGGVYAELVALQGGNRDKKEGALPQASSNPALPSLAKDGEAGSAAPGAGEMEGVKVEVPPPRARADDAKRPSVWGLALRYWPYLFIGLLAECCLGVMFPLWGYFLANIMCVEAMGAACMPACWLACMVPCWLACVVHFLLTNARW
jgi:hypothetical protein